MKKALIFTSSGGHLSIAQAIEAILKKTSGLQPVVHSFAVFHRERIYTSLYRYFPPLLRTSFNLGKKESIQKTVKLFSQKTLTEAIRKTIKEEKPDLIISTNFFFNPGIEQVNHWQKKPIPFINIVTDPYEAHPLIFSAKADYNLVYNQQAVKIGLNHQINKEKLTAIGWLVRPRFYQQKKEKPIREKLGFEADRPTFLICGGSEGASSIIKILPALVANPKPLQVIVVCGRNKPLYKGLNSFKKLLPKLKKMNLKNPNQLNLKLFKYTKKLDQLMAISDLVIGKAGPNLLFETVASQKPFMAICYVAPHEKANLELIKKKKLGLVEESPVKIIKTLEKIVDRPNRLNKYQPFINRERSNNRQAGKKLVEIIQKLT